jgi:low affinity Fe/Cu permease
MEKLKNALELAAPYVVTSSIGYEFFYFKGLGYQLSSTPLGVADFFRGWLFWLAVVLPAFVGFFVSSTSSKPLHILPSNLQQPTENSTCTYKFIYYFSLYSPYLFSGTGITVFIWFLFLGEQVAFALQMAILLVFLGILEKMHQWSMTRVQTVATALTALFLCVCVFGFERGAAVLDDEFRATRQSFVGVTKLDEQEVDVIRIYDQWSLVRLYPKQYAWINHQSGHSIKFSVSRKRFQGIFCIKNDDWCYLDKIERESYK